MAKKKAEPVQEFTRQEQSLLLFLETCATDRGGLVGGRHMNKDDFAIAEQWDSEGFIQFSRLLMEHATATHDHAVILSDAAYDKALQFRKERGRRKLEQSTGVKESIEHFSKLRGDAA